MSKRMNSYLIGILGAASVMCSMAVTAAGLPLSCTTVNSKGGGNNYTVQAIIGHDASGNPILAPLTPDPTSTAQFPPTAPCPADSTKQCADFGYVVTSTAGATVSHTLFGAAANYTVEPDPSLSEDIYAPGEGSPDGFLQYAMHEKAVRFNSKGTTYEAHIYVEGSATAGATTAYIQGGKIDEACEIAGPGNVSTLADVWKPVTTSKTATVLHGTCPVTLNYNPNGKLTGVTLSQTAIDNGCVKGQIPAGAKLSVGGLPVQNVDAPNGISFGDHSTIVYLPSGIAVCTATPCPGTATYVFQ